MPNPTILPTLGDPAYGAALLPINADTCTVNGWHYRQDSPAWRGLDLASAEVRTQAPIWRAFFGRDAPFDLHLRVPFCHPEDTTAAWAGCFYRVRPKMKPGRRWRDGRCESVTLERAGNGPWMLSVTWAGRARAAGVPVVGERTK